MLVRFLTALVRRRNPHFQWDAALQSADLWVFAYHTARMLLRGQRLWFRGRKPHGLLLESGVRLRYIHQIRWGRWVRLGQGTTLSGLGRQGLQLGHHVSIGAFSRLIVGTSLSDLGSHIRIGDHVGIGEYAYLGGGGGLDIGDECIVGQYFSCHPENHHYSDTRQSIRWQGVSRKGIRIGRNCWIGSKVTILDGVTLGQHCVVAAGSVVTQSFPDYSVIGGVPARLIKTIPHHD